ncbi:hypothetical protein BDW62DRAFT_214750 [Aspergillus aurantiobrunneus]
MSDISTVRERIFKDGNEKRITMKINIARLDSRDYSGSAKKVLDGIFPDRKDDDRILFLAVEVFDDRTYMVLDINHHDYNFRTAHKDKRPIDVYLIRQIHKGQNWALVRSPRDNDYVCNRLADLHRAHGYDVKPPIVEDHTSIIVHANPRSPAQYS